MAPVGAALISAADRGAFTLSRMSARRRRGWSLYVAHWCISVTLFTLIGYAMSQWLEDPPVSALRAMRLGAIFGLLYGSFLIWKYRSDRVEEREG